MPIPPVPGTNPVDVEARARERAAEQDRRVVREAAERQIGQELSAGTPADRPESLIARVRRRLRGG